MLSFSALPLKTGLLLSTRTPPALRVVPWEALRNGKGTEVSLIKKAFVVLLQDLDWLVDRTGKDKMITPSGKVLIFLSYNHSDYLCDGN